MGPFYGTVLWNPFYGIRFMESVSWNPFHGDSLHGIRIAERQRRTLWRFGAASLLPGYHDTTEYHDATGYRDATAYHDATRCLDATGYHGPVSRPGAARQA